MQMLSEDDRNLCDMTREELDAAWDLWFDLAQSTNDADPLYEHGVFVGSVLLHTTRVGGGDSRRLAEPLEQAPARDDVGD